ncbi:JAB domain-containing protein [Exiguobacterium artemiae]|uniref:JAB domain-containing protein n=1 Tax=Exiguobacterium artemiae TaxID=340145 RepID=UPI003CFF941C
MTGVHIAHTGQLNSSLMHPHEISKILVMYKAASYALVHNHPSGTTEPSRENVQVTSRMIDVGYLMGIPLVDYAIVSKDYMREYSLREHVRSHRLDFNASNKIFDDPRSVRSCLNKR